MTNLLIIGAGVSGNIIGQEIIKSNNANLVGYIDDDENKHNLKLNGKPIFGSTSILIDIINKYNINKAIISMPSSEGKVIKSILNKLIKKDIQIQIVPGYFNILKQDIEISYPIRDVDIPELLGRPKTEIDVNIISPYISHKRVLITGAGGSIGSELSKLIAGLNPKELIVLGRGENSIHLIYDEVKYYYPNIKISPVIANITNYNRLYDIFKKYKPHVVFHAAAHKHVNFMEVNIKEAFINNVMGSKNLLMLSKEFNVERFVLISTDKAVRPKNIMGITKRICELMMSYYSQNSNTIFCSVRFGNVLGSRGSVLPIFRRQIQRGGPVTVTHKDVVRYFMTIPEASQLVLQAGGMAKANEIFILNMGEPIQIYELAKLLIQLYNSNIKKDVDIKIIGLRPGEKLKEELWTKYEKAKQSEYKDIYVIQSDYVKKDLLETISHIDKNINIIKDIELKSMLIKAVESISKPVCEKL